MQQGQDENSQRTDCQNDTSKGTDWAGIKRSEEIQLWQQKMLQLVHPIHTSTPTHISKKNMSRTNKTGISFKPPCSLRTQQLREQVQVAIMNRLVAECFCQLRVLVYVFDLYLQPLSPSMATGAYGAATKSISSSSGAGSSALVSGNGCSSKPASMPRATEKKC